MTEFTPVAGAVGGVLIGLSAALGYLALGKVTGISGIIGRGLTGAFGHQNWGLWFLIGLIVTPWVVHQIAPVNMVFRHLGRRPLLPRGYCWVTARAWAVVTPAAMASAAWLESRFVQLWPR